jgi:hypothetical protein
MPIGDNGKISTRNEQIGTSWEAVEGIMREKNHITVV